MAKAGATNEKIIRHGDIPAAAAGRGFSIMSDQTRHSAKSLSYESMERARRIQSAMAAVGGGGGDTRGGSPLTSHQQQQQRKRKPGHRQSAASAPAGMSYSKSMADLRRNTSATTTSNKPPPAAGRQGSGSNKANRPTTAKSKNNNSVFGAAAGESRGRGAHVDMNEMDSDMILDENTEMRYRRVSWAYEHPFEQLGNDMNLNDTKMLLRSQIRAKGEVMPPDFVYLTVNSIQQSMKASELSKNMEINRRLEELQLNKKFGRPSSSPSRIDPRSKVPLDELSWEQFLVDQGKDDGMSEVDSLSSVSTKQSVLQVPTTTTILTEFGSVPVDAKPYLSMHSEKTKSSIPPPKLLRPHTATVWKSGTYYQRPAVPPGAVRPQSAAVHTASSRARDMKNSSSRPSAPTAGSPSSLVTTGEMTPMLMYSKQVKDKLAEMKQRSKDIQSKFQFHSAPTSSAASAVASTPATDGGQRQQPIGNVSQYNHPMRSHVDFKLKTHQQVDQEMKEMRETYKKDKVSKYKQQERKQKAAWSAKVTGKTNKDFARKPKSMAPELGEYKEFNEVS